MFCPNCGTQNENEARNCSQCGTLLVNEQEAVAEEAVSAPESAPVEEVAAPVATEELSEPATFAEEYIPEKEGGKAKKLIIGAVALVAVAIVAFFGIKFIGGLFGDDDQKDYSKYPIVYAKDGEVMVRPDGKKESYEIGDTNDFEGPWSFQIVDDGKIMFYNEAGDLYYRKVKDMDSDKAVKIDKDVEDFIALENGDGVVYEKKDKLYYSNLKEEKVIDNEIDYFVISDDDKRIVYKNHDGDLYVCGFGKKDEADKIDSNVDSFYSGDGEYKDLYYIKEGKLYYKEEGGNKEKVMSDVVNGAMIDGKLYVLKSEEKKLTFDDLFIDDLSNNPDLIDPDSIVEPERRDYASYDDYWDAWDAYYDEYYEAYELWYMYEEMDTLKEELEDDPVVMNTYTLYAVDGKKATKLDEGLTNSYINMSEDYGFYTKAEQAKIEKIKMSEVSSIYSARYEAENKLGGESNEGTVCIITPSGKVFDAIEKDKEYVSDFTVSENGKYLYCAKYKDSSKRDVIRYNIGSSELSKEKKVLDGITDWVYFEDDLIVGRSHKGELVAFDGKKEVEISDESTSAPQYLDGALYYLDDYSNGSGELVKYKNGKKTTLTNDVYQFYVYGKNKIACIKDYEAGEGGELYICKDNGKCTLIDNEVSGVVFIY